MKALIWYIGIGAGIQLLSQMGAGFYAVPPLLGPGMTLTVAPLWPINVLQSMGGPSRVLPY